MGNVRKRATRPTHAFWVIAALVVFAVDVPAQTNAELEALAAQGREALAEQRFSQALQQFRAGRERASANESWQGRFLFYEALTLQQQAQSVRNQAELLRQSERLYRAYLDANPESAAGFNNLAKVQELLGNDAQAEKNYGRAVSLGDKRRAFYLQNLAEFAAKSGDERKAQKITESLALANPLDDSLHRQVIQQYIEYDDEAALLLYLWQSLELGLPDRAVRSSLDMLVGRRDWLEQHTKESLLTLVCVGLSRSARPWRPDPGLMSRIDRLSGDDQIGDGAAELLRLYEDTEGIESRPVDFAWWRVRGSIDSDAEIGVWPVDGIRTYIRAMGNAYKQEGDSEAAIRYFRLAIDLHPREPDPAAFRELLDVYIHDDNIREVQSLATEYQRHLFERKSVAYRTSNFKKIFEFHRTLGELYSFLGQWGDDGNIRSAVFQLNNARTISQRIEAENNGQLDSRYQFTPAMTDALAKAYANSGNLRRSYETRVEQAEYYKDRDRLDDARLVLDPIKNTPLPPTLSPGMQINYENLLNELPSGNDVNAPRNFAIREDARFEEAAQPQ